MVLAGVLASACGYGSAGTWVDDPANFERAWGVAKPADVDLVRSWYWRSPHWTREEAYFFHLRCDEAFLHGIAEVNGLRPGAPATGAEIAAREYGFERPEWFAAGPHRTFATWESASPEVFLCRDEETGDLFLWVCQL
jgi:hypothetical protein